MSVSAITRTLTVVCLFSIDTGSKANAPVAGDSPECWENRDARYGSQH